MCLKMAWSSAFSVSITNVWRGGPPVGDSQVRQMPAMPNSLSPLIQILCRTL